MATNRKHPKASTSKEYEEIAMDTMENSLEEDEFGYVIPRDKRASTVLINQLPSRHIEDLLDGGTRESLRQSSLRRKDSHYKTMQLKNATLNYHRISIDAEKIYDILTSEPILDEFEKLKTLREMHQHLTVKRQVKERLDADLKKKIATKTLGYFTRLKLGFHMTLRKFLHEVNNISYFFEPWHSSIKSIQGHFGSGVASYFIFLRWLLYINTWNFFVTFFFVVIPQMVYRPPRNDNGNSTSEAFEFSDLLTGAGWFSDSMFYFGHYTHEIINVNPNVYYNMPLAYLLTIGVNAIINLIAVSSSLTASYQRNYIDTAGEIKNVFCNKIFSAWDYGVQTKTAANLQKKAFYNEMKELLYMKKLGEETRTKREKTIQITLLALVSSFCIAVIAAMGYVTYYMLDKKALEVDIKILHDMALSLTVTFISSASYFLFMYASKLELYLSSRFKLYLTMVRVAALRLVILAIVVYFWIVILKPPRDMLVCYETELGKEIYRLILVNFLMSILVFTLLGEFLRKFISIYFSRIKPCTFDVAYNTLDLIYYQTLAWIAIFCVPFGSLMIIVILILLFYIKKSSLSLNCKPPKRSWSANEAQTFYLILTFIMFFFAAITVGYSILGQEPSYCGPFKDYEKTGDVIRKLFFDKNTTSTFAKILGYLTSPGVLFAIFCALGLVVYYMRAQAKAHISVIKKIREQLVLASKDKVFLLKLFDDAYKKHLEAKGSNIDSERWKKNESRSPSTSNSHNGDIVFNEGYTDYSKHPLGSPVHKTFLPGYLPANVPINKMSRENTPSSPTSTNSVSIQGTGFRSPVILASGDSPGHTPKGSPYPSHQPGFRHFLHDDTRGQPTE